MAALVLRISKSLKSVTFILNNDAGIHLRMYAIHQDHESQVFVNLRENQIKLLTSRILTS